MAVNSDDLVYVYLSYDVHSDLSKSCVKPSFRHVFGYSLRAEGFIIIMSDLIRFYWYLMLLMLSANKDYNTKCMLIA